MMACLFFTGVSYAKIDEAAVAGLWLFDEDDGDIVEDLSGNGNDGAFMGSPEWVKGKFGAAVEFDGSSYISVPDSDSLDMEEQVTVMFWVRSEKEMVDMWGDRQAVVGKHFSDKDATIGRQGPTPTRKDKFLGYRKHTIKK